MRLRCPDLLRRLTRCRDQEPGPRAFRCRAFRCRVVTHPPWGPRHHPLKLRLRFRHLKVAIQVLAWCQRNRPQGNKHQGNRHQSNQFQGNRHQRILRQLFRGRQRCRPRSRERPPLRHRPRCLLPSQMMCATTCSRWWVRWVWVRRLQWWARSCGGVIVSSMAGRWGAAGGGARTRHARPIRP